jgi:hypothetical protein
MALVFILASVNPYEELVNFKMTTKCHRISEMYTADKETE